MRIVLFTHSLASDWNHGNAHFLRGVARELRARGHDVRAWEPARAWSAENLVAEAGPAALDGWLAAYPELAGARHVYDPADLEAALDRALDGADLVLMHEWNEHALVAAAGRRRARGGGFRLLFHDTHHRSVTDPASMGAYDLSAYDGVLAFGEAVRQVYLTRGWAQRAWTWHEAADEHVFRPLQGVEREGDLVWVGNWGDEERTEELREFLLAPARALGLRARVHGVRYPDYARRELAEAGIEYAGWLPNYRAPETFARFGVTVHVPRRPYVRALPGVPTIRVFEALACGIPLVSAPWDDAEGLFTPGADFLFAANGDEMRRRLRDVLGDPALARSLAEHGRRTILARHTCGHRADELLAVAAELGAGAPAVPAAHTGAEMADHEARAAAPLGTALAALFGELVDGPGGSGGYMLNRGDAGLLRSLDRLSAEEASAVAPGGSSVAAHVEHLRYGLSLLNRAAAGENPFADADWGASWRHTAVDAAAWAARRAALADEARRWGRALLAPPAADGAVLRGMIGSVAHLAYHVGAIRQLARAARGPSAND